MSPESLFVHGQVPRLEGLVCERLICQGFVYCGELVTDASVVYLAVDDIWHHLVIDAGAIFWRTQADAPEPWAIPEEGFEYPHRDVGAEFGLNGKVIDAVVMTPTDAGATVEIIFADGARFALIDESDNTRFVVSRIAE